MNRFHYDNKNGTGIGTSEYDYNNATHGLTGNDLHFLRCFYSKCHWEDKFIEYQRNYKMFCTYFYFLNRQKHQR
jgi:hypothetical protein